MLYNISTRIGWRFTLFFLALNFLMQGIILGVSYPACCGLLPPLDVSIMLDGEKVYGFFNAIGEEGRALYFINQSTLDIIFPLLYAPAYLALLAQLLKYNHLLRHPWWLFICLPIGIALADFAENLQILYLVSDYPVQHNVLGLSVANFLKHMLSMVTALVLIGLAVRLLHLKLKPRFNACRTDT